MFKPIHRAGVLCLFACCFTSSTVWAEGNADAGKIKANTCFGCHGIENYQNTYPTYRVPKLAAQNKDYLIAAIKAYKNGERQHNTMSPQAASLDDADIEDIATYFSQMEMKP